MEKNTINTLKSCSSNRIILDMIRETKSKMEQNTFLIIIVDDFSSKILSSFLTMTEVLNEGVFSIDRLETTRQKFPKYHGLYFISPSEVSCKKIAEDFATPDKPQYSRAHIFFTHRLMDLTMDKLVTENLAKRVKTFRELNLSFLIKDRDLFDLGMAHALEIFTVKNNIDQRDMILSNILERLFTVCACLNEYPYIQYQKSSPLCAKLAEKMDAMLNDFYSMKTFNEQRGILLLTDRAFDVTTPFLHDYTYEALVYDLFTVVENKVTVKGKTYTLDDRDELWLKFKNKHIVNVFDEIQKEIKEFGESDISKAQKSDLETFDEMLNVVHGMKGYEKKSKQLSCHVQLCEEIMTQYKTHSLFEIIDLEQDIVTGINSEGEVIDNAEIMKKYANLQTKISDLDKLRIIITLHTCLDFSEKEFNVLAKDIADNKKRAIYNLEWLGISFSKSKAKTARREQIISKKERKEFKMKQKAIAYNTLRSQPKLESIVESCSKYQLSRVEFPFCGEEPKNISSIKPKAYHNNAGTMFGNDNINDEELPNLILFTLGGIAHNEIAALEKLHMDKKINHHLVKGSTSIVNAADFIKILEDRPLPNEIGSEALKLKSIELIIDE